MSLTLDPAKLARRQAAEADDYYNVGQAYGMLVKAASSRPVAAPVLHGRLIVPQSGWALLTVPNALVRGLFDAMDETGIELPPGHKGGPFVAHISVMTGDEIKKLGGPDKISERGHPFSYQLGPMQSVEPQGWDDMSRVWFVKVISPELKALRKSYGLSPLPNGDHNFHVSVAVRRKNVLNQGPVSKAAAADEDEDEDEDEKKTVKIPLVMQRIVITRMSFGKPGGASGIEEFMDRIRKRCDEDPASIKAAGVADAIVSGLGKAVRGARPALAGIGKQVGSTAKPALKKVVRHVVNTPSFMAGLPEGERFLSSPLGALKNVKNVATKPHWPGLDRPVGVTELPRALDRPRAAIGKSLRAAPTVGMLGSLGLGGYGIGWAGPGAMADQLADATGFTGDRDALRWRMRKTMPRVYLEGLKNMVGLGANDPASKFVKGVAGDVTVPSIRYGIHNALNTDPVPAPAKGNWWNPFPAMSATTPMGAANTAGLLDPLKRGIVSLFGSSQRPDYLGSLKKHGPPLIDAVRKDPSVLKQSPYAGIINDIMPTDSDAIRRIKPREMAANLAGYWGGATPEQQQKIKGTTVPGAQPYNPTLGELEGTAKHWANVVRHPIQDGAALDELQQRLPAGAGNLLEQARNISPDQRHDLFDRLRQRTTGDYQQRIDALLERMHGLRKPSEKAGAAVTALARLTCEKRADDADMLVPGLVGAGVGGFGGWGLGKVFGSDHPWHDILQGAGVGGLVGMAYGSRKGQNKGLYGRPDTRVFTKEQADALLPPPTAENTKYESLADNVEHYYDNVPGGFDEELREAVKDQQPMSPDIGAPKYTEEDVRRKFPITTVDVPDPAENELPNKGLFGVTVGAGDDPKYTRIGVVGPSDVSQTEYELTKQHELTHSATHGYGDQSKNLSPRKDYNSGKKLIESLGSSVERISPDADYLLGSNEFDPRLAMVKRQYALHNPGKTVRSPADARKALEWFQDWVETREGRRATGIEGADWRSIFATPGLKRALEPGMFRRMPKLVQLDQPDTGTKVAGAWGDAASGFGKAFKSWLSPSRLGRHWAGIREGEGFFGKPGAGGLRRTGATLGNAYRTIASPRFPGFSREVSDPTSGIINWGKLWEKKNPFTPQNLWKDSPMRSGVPFEKTRNAIGEGVRLGSTLAAGGTAVVAGNNLLRGGTIPTTAASAAAAELGMNSEGHKAMQAAGKDHLQGLGGQMMAQRFGHIPGVNWFTGKPDTSAAGKIVTDVLTDTGLPYLRHDLYNMRSQNPRLMRAADWARSFSPFGLATTVGARYFASPERAGIPDAIDRAVAKHKAEFFANPVESLTSPIARPWLRMLSDPRVLPKLTDPDEATRVPKLLEDAMNDPNAQQGLTNLTNRPEVQKLIESAGNNPQMQARMMELVQQPGIQKVLTNAASSPQGQKMMTDMFQRPEMQERMMEMLQQPEMQKVLMNTTGSPQGQKMLTDMFQKPEMQERLMEMFQKPEMQEALMNTASSPQAVKTMTEMFQKPETQARLMEIFQKPEVQAALGSPQAQKMMTDAMQRPEVQQRLMEIARTPEAQRAMTGIVASPDVQSQISGQTSSSIHNLLRNWFGVNAPAATTGGGGGGGGEGGGGGSTDLVGAAMPAAQQGITSGLQESWADPQIREKIRNIGLAAAGGGLGGGVLGHALGSSVAPDDEDLTYEERRRREQMRSWLRNLGLLGGAVGTPMLANYLTRPKTAEAVGPPTNG